MSISRSQTNKRLVSAIASLDDREINPNIIDVANDDAGFDDLMMVLKRYKVTTEPFYENFVNDDVQQVIVFDSGGVAGSGTATLTVTITTTGFVKQGDKILFANDKVGMINSAITTGSSKDSFTITSVDGSNLTAVAADKVTVLATVVGERSSGTDILSYGLTKYFNQYETMRDGISLSDVQMNSKVTVGDGYYTFYQAQQQARQFKLRMSATFLAGVKSVNQYGTATPTLTDKDGNSVQTTGGVNSEVVTYGINDTVATPGTVLMTDLGDLLDQILAVKGPKNYVMLTPDKAWRKYDDLFKSLGSSATIASARLNMDSTEVNYNVSKVTYGTFMLQIANLKLLDHPQQFGFTGSSTIGKSIYGIPNDKVKVQNAGGQGSEEVRIGIRYAPNPGPKNQGTEYIQETHTGGLAPGGATSEVQELKVSFIARQGVEVLGAKQLFKHRVLV